MLGNIKGAYEKQMRTLMNDNEQLKQHIQQTDRTISQLKKENEELQLSMDREILIIRSISLENQ